jgi:hypothetical protein
MDLGPFCAKWTRPPDWIRLDVQGLEFEALHGAREVICAGRGRLRVVAEMHPQQWPECGIHPREAVERLAALGLRARSVSASVTPFTQDSPVMLEPL